MYKIVFVFLMILAPVCLFGQVVDRIKTASDERSAGWEQEAQNPYDTYINNYPSPPPPPVNNYPYNGSTQNVIQGSGSVIPPDRNQSFGASNSSTIYPTTSYDPEDDYVEERRYVDNTPQPESNWALHQNEIRKLEEEELAAYLLEESRRGRYRRVFAEFRAQAALRTEYQILLPRARAGYAFLSTEIRLNQLIETGATYRATYGTWDWQILRVRIIDWKHCSFSMGYGLTFEPYSGDAFSEITAEAAFNFFDGRLQIPLEARASIFQDDIIKTELSAVGNWLLTGRQHSSIYFSLGAIRQDYFGEVSTNGVILGLNFTFY